MRTYYFGNMEFGTANIHGNVFEFCMIHDLEETREFNSMEEAEMYAEANQTGDYIVANHDSIEILFAESCLWNGSLEINPLVETKDSV
jgi:formylglycine-generating enzyme required for sulfatase activity